MCMYVCRNFNGLKWMLSCLNLYKEVTYWTTWVNSLHHLAEWVRNWHLIQLKKGESCSQRRFCNYFPQYLQPFSKSFSIFRMRFQTWYCNTFFKLQLSWSFEIEKHVCQINMSQWCEKLHPDCITSTDIFICPFTDTFSLASENL